MRALNAAFVLAAGYALVSYWCMGLLMHKLAATLSQLTAWF